METLLKIAATLQLLHLVWILQGHSRSELKCIWRSDFYSKTRTGRWLTIWLMNTLSILIWVLIYFLWNYK